jgi:hypothetical protein
MRRFLPVALVLMLLAMPAVARPQGASDAGLKNAAQAREVLDAMVRALGGEAWLNTKNQMRQGNLAAFIHGEPSGGATEFREYHAWPDHDRIEFGKRRDVVQFFVGRAGTEVTYKGKAPLPQEQVDDLLRRRDHSVETAVKVWLNDPRTILIYEGRQLTERHLADQVTLISAENEAVTILADVETHLPLRRTFEWRDPVYKDKNLDAEEYDNYHTINGLPTPLTITRFKNGDVTRQYFLTRVSYNQKLPDDFWSVDAAERRIRK